MRSSATENGGGSGVRSRLLSTTTWRRCSSPAPCQPELAVDETEALVGVALGGVDHVDEEARPSGARGTRAEADSSLAPSIRPGTSGDDELPVAAGRVHGAEHRLERRERVGGDLRPCVRDPAQERRLARVREPDERRVGEKLQPHLELGLVAGGVPVSANRGVWRVAVAKRAFPRPPSPPRASTSRWPGVARSTSSSSSPALQTCVPTGTARTASSPLAPCRRLPPPLPPRPPRYVAFVRNAERSRSVRVGDDHDVATTAAVAAVRPALGDEPRRKLSAPSPPRPAITCGCWPCRGTCAESQAVATDLVAQSHKLLRPRSRDAVGGRPTRCRRSACRRSSGTRPCPRAWRRLCRRGRGRAVAWAEPRAALADDDHPGLHVLAVEDLHPEHLRIRVAAAARGPEALLVRH